jgi:zinc D-Ala-D-Ala carboxypeptidase
MNLVSEHISWAEATRSDAAKRAGINNYFTPEQLVRMTTVAKKVFEPVRNHFGIPVFVSSFFRNAIVNKLIGGAVNSQHMANNGAAIDVDAEVYGKVTNKQIFEYIKNNLEFDQLIWEFGTNEEPDWVHVSYNEGHNRKEILKAFRGTSGTQYAPYV